MFAQFQHWTWKGGLLATVVSMLASMLAFAVALAASGDLDTTFNGDGRVISIAVPSSPGRSDRAWSIAVQADGRIVTAGDSYIPSTSTGDFALLRYKTDGSLDATFSGDGRLVTNFGGIDEAYDVVLQSNSKIVAAGRQCNNTYTICDVALARYNTNGTLDITFSGDGRQANDFGAGNNGSYGGLAIQSNGKIVVAGYMWNGTDYDFAVYRYLSNGSLDTGFSGDGMINISFGAGRREFASDVVIQSDGKILIVGSTSDPNYANHNFAIARLNAGGSLDTTFSGDGKQTTDFGASDYPYSVALQEDGKIVVAGRKDTATLGSVAVARYNPDGSLDTTFNGSGKKVFSVISGADSRARDVVLQSDGKIVMMGSTNNGSGDFNFALVRLNSRGSFDTTFSGDGKVTVNFGGDDFGLALSIQSSDGNYVLAGYTNDGTQRDFALARVFP